MKRIAVIGGGISGLSVANLFCGRGQKTASTEAADVVVFEKERTPSPARLRCVAAMPFRKSPPCRKADAVSCMLVLSAVSDETSYFKASKT